MKRPGLLLAALAIATVCLLPFMALLAASIRTSEGSGFTAQHYVSVFADRPFGAVLLRSLLVASMTTLLAILFASAAAFALAKLELRFGSGLLATCLAISMFPPIATVSPLFLVVKALGWRDTLAGLVVPYTTFALPLAIWIMTGFFRAVPDDLYRAARIDGCTPWLAFRKVMLPVAGPGVATSAILVFIAAWNELLFALTFTTSPEARTVPAAIALFAAEHREPWGEIAAASAISTLPLLIATLVFQRRIVQGLTNGAIKG